MALRSHPVVTKATRWLFTVGASVLGGGIAGAFAAAMDSSKYQFPHDFGSGKLWRYFFMGAALTLGGSLLRSPWGLKLMASFQQSQAQLAASRQDLDRAASDLKAGVQKDQPKQ